MDADSVAKALAKYIAAGRNYGAVTLFEHGGPLSADQKERVSMRHAALERARAEYFEAVRAAEETESLRR